jgi:hypothetical protein
MVLVLQIRLDRAIQCLLAALIVGAQRAARLEDGEAMVVFVQDLECWRRHTKTLVIPAPSGAVDVRVILTDPDAARGINCLQSRPSRT